jgi:hypothetical protein
MNYGQYMPGNICNGGKNQIGKKKISKKAKRIGEKDDKKR